MNGLDRLREQRDAGFSITELLVTMLITGIALAMVGTFFANVGRLTTSANMQRLASGQATLALDAVRNAVRVASDNPTSATTTDPAVANATAKSVTVVSYSNTTGASTTPSRVTFTIGATGFLTEMRQLGTKNSNGYWVFTGPTTTRPVAGPFDITPATAFFTYLNTSGTVLTPSGTSSLSSTSRATVTFIRVTATVDSTMMTGSDDPVIVSSAIGMPNLTRDVSSTVSVPTLPTPTATPTPTPTPTTVTPSATATVSTAPSATASATPSSSATASAAPSASATATASPSATPTATTPGSATPIPTPTASATPSASATPTVSATPSASATPTASATPSATATPTPTPTPTPTRGVQ